MTRTILIIICTILGSGIIPKVSGLMVEHKLAAASSINRTQWPLVVPLIRESIPVVRNNVTLSHKTSYSGMISVGTPAQVFRVVFDTGSAHIVLPSKGCQNETCLEHRRYDINASTSALAINGDGKPVPEDDLADQVTIGYGTGTVKGEFVREQACPGHAAANSTRCIEVSVVMAVEMSDNPFKSFVFDGIFGLALDSLAMSPEFSFMSRLGASGAAKPQFGVYLSDKDDDQSEISFGGHNTQKVLTPLRWAPVSHADMGYWQVSIKEVRIDGRTLPVCEDGTCRGIVDTGTSHLGVPGPFLREFVDDLSVDVPGESTDCRSAAGSLLEIVLSTNITLKMKPEDYMRPISLPTGLNVGMSNGKPVLTGVRQSQKQIAALQTHAGGLVASSEVRTCAPKMMPLNFPAPLGPKLFILGEPVLQKYYTSYDFQKQQVGFGIAASAENKLKLEAIEQVDDETWFMQVTVKVQVRAHSQRKRKVLSLA